MNEWRQSKQIRWPCSATDLPIRFPVHQRETRRLSRLSGASIVTGSSDRRRSDRPPSPSDPPKRGHIHHHPVRMMGDAPLELTKWKFTCW